MRCSWHGQRKRQLVTFGILIDTIDLVFITLIRNITVVQNVFQYIFSRMTKLRMLKLNRGIWRWKVVEAREHACSGAKIGRKFIQSSFEMTFEKNFLGNLFFDKKELRANVLLSAQNWETLTRLVARWGAWRTLFNWNTLKGNWKILVPVWRMGNCVPFPIVTLSLPLYDCLLSREVVVWERWWVARVSKNHSLLFMLIEDAITTWA